jgi:hypothetical protein
MSAVRAHAVRLSLLAVVLITTATSVHGLELITKEEASLPPGTPTELRGPIPGPVIEVKSPPSDVRQKSPLRLLVTFTTRSGSPVDKDSVRLIYIKNPLVELTNRVHDFITPTGIEVRDAQVPPGSHTIRIQLKDLAGRPSSKYFTFEVGQ